MPSPVPPEDAAIIRLKKLQYCRAADTEDWDLFESMFLPDVTVHMVDDTGTTLNENGIEHKFSSRDAWMTAAKAIVASMQIHHTVAEPELELIEPGVVRGIWNVTYHMGTKGPEGGTHSTGGGFYYETWKKVGDDWFMADMEMQRAFWKIVKC